MSGRVIVYGGSFDPTHEGHKALIKTITKIFKPEKTILVPCFIQPIKGRQHADASHRLEMLKLMFREEDIEVSDYEIEKGDISYSVDTVEYFRNIFRNHKIYFLMGEDSFLSLTEWKEYERLVRISSLIVVSRSKDFVVNKTVAKSINKASPVTRKLDKNFFCAKLKGMKPFYFISDFFHKASSTDIRRNLLNNEKEHIDYVDPLVLKYIRDNNLYRKR